MAMEFLNFSFFFEFYNFLVVFFSEFFFLVL